MELNSILTYIILMSVIALIYFLLLPEKYRIFGGLFRIIFGWPGAVVATIIALAIMGNYIPRLPIEKITSWEIFQKRVELNIPDGECGKVELSTEIWTDKIFIKTKKGEYFNFSLDPGSYVWIRDEKGKEHLISYDEFLGGILLPNNNKWEFKAVEGSTSLDGADNFIEFCF